MRATQSILVGAIAAAALAFAACAAEPEGSVFASGVALDRTTQALTAVEIHSANGTYGPACINRGEDEYWSVAVGAGVEAGDLAHWPLSVVQGDTDCTLTLQQLVLFDGAEADDPIDAVAPIALGAAWGTASSFLDGGDAIIFFANAMLDSVAFDVDFTLTILFSDDADIAAQAVEHPSGWYVVEGSTATESVDAPAYDMADNLHIETNLSDIVTNAWGSIDLTLGAEAQAGQHYVVVELDLAAASYDDVHEAFATVLAVALPDPSNIPSDDFNLLGQDVSGEVVRTLIIRNEYEGVASYQTFTFSFVPVDAD